MLALASPGSSLDTSDIHAGRDVKDFDIAASLARSRCESARFFLTVKSWDIDECK